MKNNGNQEKPIRLLARLRHRISLHDHVDVAIAGENIRRNILFNGPNVYILAFAIVIASVGLNVNSIPVIIGAMLVSPLMGPILGIGLAVGINDTRLLRDALKNLGVMVIISIVASTLYFLLSPLKLENPTELLARTNPTIYDVMIALFGGFAGILETCRKDKGTVMSGVAIATALMPPLCTIGFGIATLNLHYALGALYLFFINGVFIALATFAGVKYLGFEQVSEVDTLRQRRSKRIVSFAIVVLIIPSIISAVSVIRQNNFERNVDTFVKKSKVLGNNYIYDYRTTHDGRNSTVELFIATDNLDSSNKETLYQMADEQGLKRSQLMFNTDILGGSAAEGKLTKDLLAREAATIVAKDSTIAKLERRLKAYEQSDLPSQQLEAEIKAQYPNIQSATMARGTRNSADSNTLVLLVQIQPSNALQDADKSRLTQWLKIRTQIDDVRIVL